MILLFSLEIHFLKHIFGSPKSLYLLQNCARTQHRTKRLLRRNGGLHSVDKFSVLFSESCFTRTRGLAVMQSTESYVSNFGNHSTIKLIRQNAR